MRKSFYLRAVFAGCSIVASAGAEDGSAPPDPQEEEISPAGEALPAPEPGSETPNHESEREQEIEQLREALGEKETYQARCRLGRFELEAARSWAAYHELDRCLELFPTGEEFHEEISELLELRDLAFSQLSPEERQIIERRERDEYAAELEAAYSQNRVEEPSPRPPLTPVFEPRREAEQPPDPWFLGTGITMAVSGTAMSALGVFFMTSADLEHVEGFTDRGEVDRMNAQTREVGGLALGVGLMAIGVGVLGIVRSTRHGDGWFGADVKPRVAVGEATMLGATGRF